MTPGLCATHLRLLFREDVRAAPTSSPPEAVPSPRAHGPCCTDGKTLVRDARHMPRSQGSSREHAPVPLPPPPGALATMLTRSVPDDRPSPEVGTEGFREILEAVC